MRPSTRGVGRQVRNETGGRSTLRFAVVESVRADGSVDFGGGLYIAIPAVDSYTAQVGDTIVWSDQAPRPIVLGTITPTAPAFQHGTETTAGTVAETFDFPADFAATPTTVIVTAEDGVARVTAKTASDFTVLIEDATGTAVGGDFDWAAWA